MLSSSSTDNAVQLNLWRTILSVCPYMLKEHHSVLRKESKTVGCMIHMYCHTHHGTSGSLCVECEVLLTYAQQRILNCPFQEQKPTCSKCPVHCYKPVMREDIRKIMRYAGPRMLHTHPILALFHMLHGLKTAPATMKKTQKG